MSKDVSNIKKLFNHSSHYFLGKIFGMVAGIISFPILTRVFSVSEYGSFGLITATVFILVAIAKCGAQYSAVRYYNEYNNGEINNSATYYTTFFAQSFLFTFAVAAIFLALARILFSAFSVKFDDLIWFVAIMAINNSLLLRLNNFLLAEQKTKLYNIVTVINRYCKLGAGMFFVFFVARSVSSFLTGQVIIDILFIIIYIYFLLKKDRLKLKAFSTSLFKASLFYGFPLLLLELSSLFFKFIDRYIIKLSLDMYAVGIYTVGADLSEYIQDMIFIPVSMAIFPVYMEIWSKKGKEEVERFLSTATDYLMILCIPLIFGVSILSKEIVTILASNKFAESARIIPFIVTGTIIWGFYSLFAAGLYIYNKTKITALIVFLTSCFNIVLNLLLIPVWGIMGSAVSILISYVIMTCMVIKISFKYIKIEFKIINICKYIAVSIIMSLIIYQLKLDKTIFNLITKIITGAISYSLILMLIDTKIRDIVTEKCKGILLKKQ